MRVWIKRVNKNSDRRFQHTDICWDTENMLSVLARRVVEQIQMKMTRPIGKILAGLCFMGLIASCDSSKENQLNVKHRESYHINPEVTTNGISTAQYSVDSVCSLQVSDDIVEIRTSKIIAANGRIYLLDAEITKKLYVFDSKGNLTATIGERGRARNEFVGKPDDFFVDSKNRLHVFDKIGHKIIVYDGNGAFCDVIMTDAYYPHSIGLTGTDKYMMYFNVGQRDESVEGDVPSSLLLFDQDFKKYKKLMPSEGDLHCSVSQFTFFRDGERLAYIPCFSDSVIVFKNDAVEKVVSFEFDAKVLSKDNPDLLRQQDYSFMSFYQGVLGLNRYQETDSFIYLDYIYMNQSRYWLYVKNSGQAFSGTKIFEGVAPYSYYCTCGNQIVGYISKNTVESLKRLLDNEQFQENLRKSPGQIKDIIEGKIATPALIFITIK